MLNELYQRNYISDEPIKSTQLGIKTVEALEKYTPRILDQKLTKHFEDEMEEIQDGKKHKKRQGENYLAPIVLNSTCYSNGDYSVFNFSFVNPNFIITIYLEFIYKLYFRFHQITIKE